MSHLHPIQTKLANGIPVVVTPLPDSQLVTVYVGYSVGSRHEVPGSFGIAHLFEHLMFDNGGDGIKKQYDKLCTRVGGFNNAYTTYDFTAYHITLPAHELELGLWLESERLRSFTITDEDLKIQKGVVIEEIKQNILNQPYSGLRTELDKIAYSHDHGYSKNVYGNIDDITNLTIDTIRDFFIKFYHTQNVTISVAGGIDANQVIRLSEATFGRIKPVVLSEGKNNTTLAKCTKQHSIVTDNVPVPAVIVAFHLPGMTSDEMYNADLLATLVGSGKNSYLYRELVVNKQIASEVGCYVDKRLLGSLLICYAYAASSKISSGQLTESILYAIKTAQVGQDDLASAKARVVTDTIAQTEGSEIVAESVAWFSMFKQAPEEINYQKRLYESRNIETVQDLVSVYMKPEQMLLVEVVPLA